jgi:K+-sensing histidine kinase KdpD
LLTLLKHPRVMPVYWVALSLLIIAADHLTDPYIQFPILFLFPIMLASVYNGRWWGVGLAIVMPTIRCYFEVSVVPWAMPQEVINTGIRLIVLVVFAVLVDRTAQQTRALQREVTLLRGILPICSFCKKIRQEDNTWEHMETYITKRSEAQFSHSVCPDCLKVHYPDFAP